MTRNIYPDNKENEEHGDLKDRKILTFAVPGGKVYINDFLVMGYK